MINRTPKELTQLLDEEGLAIEDSVINSNEVIVLPSKGKMLTTDDVWITRQIRASKRKVHVPDYASTQIRDFRGGEWEHSLIIVAEAAKDVIIAVASAWIYKKIEDWKEKKKGNPNGLNAPPAFKLRYYFTKSKRYVEIEGDAESSLKALDSLKDEKDV